VAAKVTGEIIAKTAAELVLIKKHSHHLKTQY